MLRTAIGWVSLLIAAVAMAPTAQADSPVTCGQNLFWDGQKCQLIARTGGDEEGIRGSGTANNSFNRGSVARTCSMGGTEIPCQDPELGWWQSSRSCYVKASSQQPVQTDPVWEGHVDWVQYDCVVPGGTSRTPEYVFMAPMGLVGLDPRALAQTAIESMELTPVSIGIVPEDVPGSVGLVGMPVWLWAADPDQHSWGPITRTASAGGATVTATAKVKRMRWLMGDGEVVVCTGPGTVYEDRFGKTDSPTCGYTYSRQGTYTVRAESQWSVAWSGMGLSGTIPVTLTDSTTVTIGELQVLTIG